MIVKTENIKRTLLWSVIVLAIGGLIWFGLQYYIRHQEEWMARDSVEKQINSWAGNLEFMSVIEGTSPGSLGEWCVIEKSEITKLQADTPTHREEALSALITSKFAFDKEQNIHFLSGIADGLQKWIFLCDGEDRDDILKKIANFKERFSHVDRGGMAALSKEMSDTIQADFVFCKYTVYWEALYCQRALSNLKAHDPRLLQVGTAPQEINALQKDLGALLMVGGKIERVTADQHAELYLMHDQITKMSGQIEELYYAIKLAHATVNFLFIKFE